MQWIKRGYSYDDYKQYIDNQYVIDQLCCEQINKQYSRLLMFINESMSEVDNQTEDNEINSYISFNSQALSNKNQINRMIQQNINEFKEMVLQSVDFDCQDKRIVNRFNSYFETYL